MPSGDGWLLRVKPFGGRLQAEALRAIATVAVRDGNGVVELTARGNIQLRGLSPATAARAAATLVEAGLADRDPARERRRNVIAVPPCDDALAAEIEAVLADCDGLAPKFCVAVGRAEADIGLLPNGGEVRVMVNRRATVRTRADIARTIRHLAGIAAGRRMRDVEIAEPGWIASDPDTPEPARDGLLVALPFGQTDADTLMALAELLAGSEARTTPWRAFHLAGVHDPAPFAALGFITDPDDPRRTLHACAGAPRCAGGSVPAREDAAILAGLGIRHVHVSGCAKGCAYPGAAHTLVGRGGLYDLVRHGRAGDAPDIPGLTLPQAAALLHSVPAS